MNICINKFSNVSSPQFDRLLTDLVFGAKIYISVWAANEMGLGLVNKVTYYLLCAVRQVGQLLCVGNSAFGRFASIQALSLERRFNWATRGGGNRGTGRGVVGREEKVKSSHVQKKSNPMKVKSSESAFPRVHMTKLPALQPPVCCCCPVCPTGQTN